MNEIEQALRNLLDNLINPTGHKRTTAEQIKKYNEAVGQAKQALASLQGNEGALEEFDEMVKFLCGMGTFNGCQFSERPPEARGKYWWRNDLLKMSKTLRAALQQGAWMPIETAPKDGQRLLLHMCRASIPSIGFFDKTRDGWFDTGLYTRPLKPTHWMPLPEKPNE